MNEYELLTQKGFLARGVERGSLAYWLIAPMMLHLGNIVCLSREDWWRNDSGKSNAGNRTTYGGVQTIPSFLELVDVHIESLILPRYTCQISRIYAFRDFKHKMICWYVTIREHHFLKWEKYVILETFLQHSLFLVSFIAFSLGKSVIFVFSSNPLVATYLETTKC